MTIYIEAVLLDNFLIDFLLLWLVMLALRKKPRWSGVFLGSVFGAGFALVSPTLPLTGVLVFICKIVVAIIMCVILEFNFNHLFLKTGLFILFTFGFGGMLIAIFSFLGVSVSTGLLTGYVSSLPLGAIVASLGMFVIWLICVLKKRVTAKNINQFCDKVLISINGKEKILNGFLDTGNTMQDEFGKPLIVMNAEKLYMWLKKEEVVPLMLNIKNNSVKNARFLPVASALGNGKMLIFDADNCVYKGQNFKVAIGLSSKKFVDFDVILSPKMVVV